MILAKFFRAIRAQLNKLANVFWEADPIAQMQYEYDQAVAQLVEGRRGLEQYRGLVERVARQVREGERQAARLTAQTKALLTAGDRDAAGTLALQLTRTRNALAENKEQLAMHEEAYGNSLKKIQHANRKLVEVKDKIQRYDADLKMSAAEAEIAKLSASFDVDVTSSFGQLEDVIRSKIDANRGKVRVAADLSREGLDTIADEERSERAQADEALSALEAELAAPERAPERNQVTTDSRVAPKATE